MRPIEIEKPITADRVRQGLWGWPVFMVLVSSLVLAAIVWLGLEFYGQAIEPAQPEPQVQTSQ